MVGETSSKVFDFVVIGSGFGGSVSALRLTEKGFSVLVIERGKKYDDQDFAKTNWTFWKYLWMPGLRSFGILQISPFRDVFVLHGSGVGGGSLVYANVLMEPSDDLFDSPQWKNLIDWKTVLRPHFDTAKRMLGVNPNPCLWAADETLKQIAAEYGTDETFQPVPVGVFFGKAGQEGVEVPDPYFSGEGPARAGCIHCGACMVGCRHNAKNTMVKNYLYLAQKRGAQVWSECEVRDIRPLPAGQEDGARYEIVYRSSTRWLVKPEKRVRARQVVFAAGALGTQRLLFRCRDITRSLPKISPRLGEMVRTNNEALLGGAARERKIDYSKGLAITSIVQVDAVTSIEPVRYPAGSSLMRFLSGPLVDTTGSIGSRLLKTLAIIFTHPMDFARTHILPGWARRTTILLAMQTKDSWMHMHFGRSLFTLWRKNLVSEPDERMFALSPIEISHQVARRYAQLTNSIPSGTINEGLFNIPMTAHILGGCPIGLNDQEGVVDIKGQVFNYPGLFIVDGSIMPANPGINPSLTITALSEYVMSVIPAKSAAQG